MSLYLEQIRQLVALQRVDDAIHSVEMELEQAPKELEELKKRFAAANTQRERVLEKLAHLKEQEKRIAGELDDDSTRIKKSKNKMMQVSNSREYLAMAREMDNMEKVNRSREEERAAFVPYKLRRFVEKTLEPQSLASLCEVSKQSVITALPFALELNPCAGHVVGHRLDAGTDQAVLGKVLKYAVAHELRRNPNPKLKRMLKQGVDAGIRKPRVHRKLHLFGRAERLRRAVHPADVVGRRRQGLSKAAAHVRGE